MVVRPHKVGFHCLRMILIHCSLFYNINVIQCNLMYDGSGDRDSYENFHFGTIFNVTLHKNHKKFYRDTNVHVGSSANQL